jgi:hypothetical protein
MDRVWTKVGVAAVSKRYAMKEYNNVFIETTNKRVQQSVANRGIGTVIASRFFVTRRPGLESVLGPAPVAAAGAVRAVFRFLAAVVFRFLLRKRRLSVPRRSRL